MTHGIPISRVAPCGMTGVLLGGWAVGGLKLEDWECKGGRCCCCRGAGGEGGGIGDNGVGGSCLQSTERPQ
jgi:hypothetical protein